MTKTDINPPNRFPFLLSFTCVSHCPSPYFPSQNLEGEFGWLFCPHIHTQPVFPLHPCFLSILRHLPCSDTSLNQSHSFLANFLPLILICLLHLRVTAQEEFHTWTFNHVARVLNILRWFLSAHRKRHLNQIRKALVLAYHFPLSFILQHDLVPWPLEHTKLSHPALLINFSGGNVTLHLLTPLHSPHPIRQAKLPLLFKLPVRGIPPMLCFLAFLDDVSQTPGICPLPR